MGIDLMTDRTSVNWLQHWASLHILKEYNILYKM